MTHYFGDKPTSQCNMLEEDIYLTQIHDNNDIQNISNEPGYQKTLRSTMLATQSKVLNLLINSKTKNNKVKINIHQKSYLTKDNKAQKTQNNLSNVDELYTIG